MDDACAVSFAEDCAAAGSILAVATTATDPQTAHQAAEAIGAEEVFYGQSKLALFRNIIENVTVTPAGFGKAPPSAPRAPVPKWMVAIEVSPEGALAARRLGMRCLGVGAVDVEEAHAHVDTLCGLVAEDIATPGAFWLQPLQPEVGVGATDDEEMNDDEQLRRILADLDAPP